MNAEICWGLYSLSWILKVWSEPIFLFAATIVLSGFVTACLRAGSPTKSSPSFENATTEGNAFPPTVAPSAAGIIVGFPPITTAAAELLVPKSIPITFAIFYHPFFEISTSVGLMTLSWEIYPFLISFVIVPSSKSESEIIDIASW